MSSGWVELYVTGRAANAFGDHFTFGVQDVTEDHLGALVNECPNMRCAMPRAPPLTTATLPANRPAINASCWNEAT
jgi:hypothetical protein